MIHTPFAYKAMMKSQGPRDLQHRLQIRFERRRLSVDRRQIAAFQRHYWPFGEVQVHSPRPRGLQKQRALMQQAEAIAASHGCTGVSLGTLAFQGPEVFTRNSATPSLVSWRIPKRGLLLLHAKGAIACPLWLDHNFASCFICHHLRQKRSIPR